MEWRFVLLLFCRFFLGEEFRLARCCVSRRKLMAGDASAAHGMTAEFHGPCEERWRLGPEEILNVAQDCLIVPDRGGGQGPDQSRILIKAILSVPGSNV